MQKSYTLLILLALASFRLGAQSISATQTNFDITVKADVVEGGIETNITNNSSSTITLAWTRTVICTSSPVWSSYVCDPNLCYGDATSQSVLDIELGPGQTGLFTFHVKPNGVFGDGEFQINVYEIANPDNHVNLVVKVNGAACSSNTNEPTAASVVLAPNPATDHFRLVNGDGVAAINLLTLDGRLVEHFEAAPDQTYSLGSLPTANYVVALLDRDGRTLRVMQLKKQ